MGSDSHPIRCRFTPRAENSYTQHMAKSGFFDFHEQVRRQRKPVSPTEVDVPKPLSSRQSEISVSELTHRIERTIKAGLPDLFHVRGEISNFRPNQASGHLYFTLKDAGSCIPCVMWSSDAARLKFTPVDGLELIAHGRVGVYATSGKYQLYVTTLRPLGQGALELAFQQLRANWRPRDFSHKTAKRTFPVTP